MDIHQPNDVQRAAKLNGVLANAIPQILAQLVCRQDTRTVPRVNAGFFDVFHDAADNDLLVIAECIDVDLVSVFEKLINEYRPLA